MKIVKKCLILLLFSLSAFGMRAQDGREFLKASDTAIIKGDYVAAKEQLEAYRAYLVAIVGKEETSPEVLKTDKKINRIASALASVQRAEALVQSFNSTKKEYVSMLSNSSGLLSDKKKYDAAMKKYETAGNTIKSAEDIYKQLVSDYPSDKSSASRIRELGALSRSLRSPSSVIRQELLRNPTRSNVDNYILFCGLSSKSAGTLRNDVNSYLACRDGGIPACMAYLSNPENKMFREEVGQMRDDLAHEELIKADENLWNKTDRTSRASLMAYMDAGNGDVKNHRGEAEKLIAEIDAYERARQDEAAYYAAVDKSSPDAIRAYLLRTPKTVYSNELYKDLDEVVWAAVDKRNILSLRAYCADSSLKTKSHVQEARGYECLIQGRTLASQKRWSEACERFDMAVDRNVTFSDSDAKLYAKAVSKSKRTSSAAAAGGSRNSIMSKNSYGFPIQALVGIRLDYVNLDRNLEVKFVDNEGKESRVTSALALNAGLKLGRNNKLLNFEAGCDFIITYLYSENDVPGVRKTEIYPNGQLKFNFMRDKAVSLNAGLGGGYKIYSAQPCVHGTVGLTSSKWYNVYGIVYVPVVSPVNVSVGFGVNIYFL